MASEMKIRKAIETLISEYPDIIPIEQVNEFISRAKEIDGVQTITTDAPRTSLINHSYIRGHVDVWIKIYRNRHMMPDCYTVRYE